MSKARTVELDFLGQKLTLKTESDFEIVQEAVAIAQIKLKDAAYRGRSMAPHHTAILALLDVCEEYVRSKRRFTEHRKQVLDRTDRLSRLMDQVAHK